MSQDLINSNAPQSAMLTTNEAQLPAEQRQKIRDIAIQKATTTAEEKQMAPFLFPHETEQVAQLVKRDEGKAQIRLKLHSLSFFMGLKDPMEKEMMELHLRFLEMNFGKMTLGQIEHAFMLAAAGRLDANPNHYNVWSPQYVSQVLNAYRKKLNKLKIRVREMENNHLMEAVARQKREDFDWDESNKSGLAEELHTWYTTSRVNGQNYHDMPTIQSWILKNRLTALNKSVDMERVCDEWGLDMPDMAGVVSDYEPVLDFAVSLFKKINREAPSYSYNHTDNASWFIENFRYAEKSE